jgi:hypothetical protein
VPPKFRRDAAANPSPTASTIRVIARTREVRTVRKTLIALAATTGLIGLTSVGASAATAIPAPTVGQESTIEKADWGCGPRCQYWQHRRWEAHREWRQHEWREHHTPYYGYNYSHGYYR